VIGRDWHENLAWNLSFAGNYRGNCRGCGTPLPGVFEGPPGAWGRRRVPVRFQRPAA
jgi:pyruvate formate lyase activating enzyme